MGTYKCWIHWGPHVIVRRKWGRGSLAHKVWNPLLSGLMKRGQYITILTDAVAFDILYTKAWITLSKLYQTQQPVKAQGINHRSDLFVHLFWPFQLPQQGLQFRLPITLQSHWLELDLLSIYFLHFCVLTCTRNPQQVIQQIHNRNLQQIGPVELEYTV